MNPIRWLIEERLRAVEHEQGVSLAYLRQIFRVSPAHFFKFSKIMPLAGFRRALPLDAYHVARIVTAWHEDCGACLHMEVRLAKKAGVSTAVIQTAFQKNPCALSLDLAEVYFFAEAVSTRNGAEDQCREAILRRYDDIGLVELSPAIAVCRVFPTVKRAMGYAVPCVPGHTQFGALDC